MPRCSEVVDKPSEACRQTFGGLPTTFGVQSLLTKLGKLANDDTTSAEGPVESM